MQNSNKEELLNNIKLCDIIIYDIISDPTQVDEASWVVSGMISIAWSNFKWILTSTITGIQACYIPDSCQPILFK